MLRNPSHEDTIMCRGVGSPDSRTTARKTEDCGSLMSIVKSNGPARRIARVTSVTSTASPISPAIDLSLRSSSLYWRTRSPLFLGASIGNGGGQTMANRSEEHTAELQSLRHLV